MKAYNNCNGVWPVYVNRDSNRNRERAVHGHGSINWYRVWAVH